MKAATTLSVYAPRGYDVKDPCNARGVFVYGQIQLNGFSLRTTAWPGGNAPLQCFGYSDLERGPRAEVCWPLNFIVKYSCFHFVFAEGQNTKIH